MEYVVIDFRQRLIIWMKFNSQNMTSNINRLLSMNNRWRCKNITKYQIVQFTLCFLNYDTSQIGRITFFIWLYRFYWKLKLSSIIVNRLIWLIRRVYCSIISTASNRTRNSCTNNRFPENLLYNYINTERFFQNYSH